MSKVARCRKRKCYQRLSTTSGIITAIMRSGYSIPSSFKAPSRGDRGIAGALEGPSSYFMKSPPRQYTDHKARLLTAAFVRGEGEPAPEMRAFSQRAAPGRLSPV